MFKQFLFIACSLVSMLPSMAQPTLEGEVTMTLTYTSNDGKHIKLSMLTGEFKGETSWTNIFGKQKTETKDFGIVDYTSLSSLITRTDWININDDLGDMDSALVRWDMTVSKGMWLRMIRIHDFYHPELNALINETNLLLPRKDRRKYAIPVPKLKID